MLDRAHPSTTVLPKIWERTDEWYNFRNNPRGDVHVLATLDEQSFNGGTMGADHPIAWCKLYEGGRSWYTASGHTPETYNEPSFRQHLLGGIQYAAGVVPGDCSATVWDNFDKVTLDDNTSNPMALDVASDGRVFYIERSGQVRVYRPTTGTSTTVGTLRVTTRNEDGLIGIALDPEFDSNGWLYLFYSPELGGSRQRVSRFTLNGLTLDVESEVTLLEIPVQRDQCCHSGGYLLFGPDGNLFIGTGDNTNPFESDGYTPIDERPDRGSWDAQKSSANTYDLRGKILRITPQADGTYTIPEGNLFTNPVAGRPEIYVMGARNPFRFSIDAERGWLYWGEVGPDAQGDNASRGPRGHDEWNQVREAGNYGWPYCIADNKPYSDYNFATGSGGFVFNCDAPVNDSPNNTGVQQLPPAKPAWIWYPYGLSQEFPGLRDGPGRTAMAGPVYHFDETDDRDTILPKYYDDTVFIYEWARSWISEVKLDDDGGVLAISPFTPNFSYRRPMDMKMGPDGALYILEWGTGFGGNNPDSRLVRVQFVKGKRAPIIVASAEPTSGPLPLAVQFDASGSFDPDPGQLITFAWDFDGDGTFDATGPNPTHTYTEAGSYTATLVVRDPDDNAVTRSFEIVAGNSLPTLVLSKPAGGMFFDWGEPVDFAIEVTDPEDGSTEDGTIDCSNVTLQLLLGHDEHAHPLDQINDCKGRFTVSEGDHGSAADRLFYVVEAIYTDQGNDGAGPLTARMLNILQPRRIEAEHYTSHNGIQVERTGDNRGGGQNIGFIDHGDYISIAPLDLFNIFAVTFRVASAGAGGRIVVRQGAPDGPILATANVEVTGDWQMYTDVTTPIEDPGGENELFFVFENQPGNTGLFNVNWIDFHGNGINSNPKERGLRAEYYDAQDFTGRMSERRDAQISFNWADDAPVAFFDNNTFSVRWFGTMTPEHTEPYRFYARSDDGMRVWLDEELVLDNWRDQPVTEIVSRARMMEGGRPYALRVEYYDANGLAQAQFSWSSPQTPKETVPYEALSPDRTDISTSPETPETTELKLYPPFPNPAQEQTSIVFGLPDPGPVRVRVHDTLGRLVHTLHDGVLAAGTHTLDLDARQLASGVYLCRLETKGGEQVQRFVVVR